MFLFLFLESIKVLGHFLGRGGEEVDIEETC